MQKTGGSFGPVLDIDAELDAWTIDRAFVSDLDRVGPFGIGNPEPLFSVKGARVASRRQVGDGHLKLELAVDGERKISCIGFRIAGNDAAFSDFLDLAFTPFVSHFGGEPRVELRLRGLRIA
jgi:single-stranded-DNA-specific exonuclease